MRELCVACEHGRARRHPNAGDRCPSFIKTDTRVCTACSQVRPDRVCEAVSTLYTRTKVAYPAAVSSAPMTSPFPRSARFLAGESRLGSGVLFVCALAFFGIWIASFVGARVPVYAASEVPLTLMEGGRIPGAVAIAAGNAAPRARVTAYVFDSPRGSSAAAQPDAEAVTDETGAFELMGLSASGYVLFSSDAYESRDFGLGALAKSVPAKTGSTVRLVLRNGGKLRGRVRFEDGAVPRKFEVANGSQ